MANVFKRLTETEKDIMYKAPILACILIAGADGKIDHHEIKGAIEATQIRLKKASPGLVEFYQMVGQDFEDKLKVLIQSYPRKPKERNQLIAEELSQLNNILPRLDKSFASEFYKSLREMAIAIAESSGGVFNKVGEEEAEWIGLRMIKVPAS